MVFLTVFFHSTLCHSNAYFGIRVAKTCNSIIRDNEVLVKKVINELKEIRIADIKSHQGDWWNYGSLTFTNIKGNFNTDLNKLKPINCTITPTGTLEYKIEDRIFSPTITFDWKYNFAIFELSSNASLDITSEKVIMKQSYSYGKTSTNINVDWKVNAIEINKNFMKFLKDWIITVINTKIMPSMNMILNSRLSVIDNELHKTYDNMTVEINDDTVTITNTIKSAKGEVYEDKKYTVISFGAAISSANSDLKKNITDGVSTNFTDTNRSFDYEICYSSKLFKEFLSFSIKTDNTNFDITKNENYPIYIGFYKTLFPHLGHIYPDDKDITISFKADPDKDLVYVEKNQLELSTIITFDIDFKYTFLTLNAIYKVEYNPILNENKHLIAVLIEPEFLKVESDPPVIGYDRFIIMDLAKRLAKELDGYNIVGEDGFYLDSIRTEQYKLTEVELRDEEVCYLYSDNPK